VADDRHSHADDAQLLSDPDEIARREAENGLRQFNLALEMVRLSVKDKERPFRLRAGQSCNFTKQRSMAYTGLPAHFVTHR